jgi:hypothetical protein
MRYTARTGADHDHQAATRAQSRLRRKLADHGSRIGLVRITESGVRGTAGGPVLYRAVWAWRLARLGGRFD